jgi:hypothetical protein
MPYTNVDIFLAKGSKSFSKKVWEPLNFMENMGKKKSLLGSFLFVLVSGGSSYD